MKFKIIDGKLIESSSVGCLLMTYIKFSNCIFFPPFAGSFHKTQSRFMPSSSHSCSDELSTTFLWARSTRLIPGDKRVNIYWNSGTNQATGGTSDLCLVSKLHFIFFFYSLKVMLFIFSLKEVSTLAWCYIQSLSFRSPEMICFLTTTISG